MTIQLADDVEELLREHLRSAESTKPSDLVNDVLRSFCDAQQTKLEVTPELEAWLLEAADSPVTPLTRGDFDAIRARVRARTLPVQQ